MPRSRGSEVPQRQSPRVPLHLKTTACSEANGVHRHTVDRSPKLEDRRSPRSPLHEKKRGTRVADLETKLNRAQEELKKLREQLASTEAAKKEAQEALDVAKKRVPAVATFPKITEEEKPPLPLKEEMETTSQCEQKVEKESPEPKSEEESMDSPATDVFEVASPVPVLAEPVVTDNEVGNDKEKAVEEKEEEESKAMIEKVCETEKKEEEESKAMIEKVCETEKKEEEDVKKPIEIDESSEVLELKAKLLKREKELENLLEENERLKKKAGEASENVMAAARAKEEELGVKLGSVQEELRGSQAKVERLGEQLEAAEGARAALEAEMKRLRVQTEQWRKAAEAAAAVLAAGEGPGAEMVGGRRVPERCGSMDKHLGAVRGGFAGWGSPLMGGEMDEEGVGGGKRRGAGIRMFGDLWKKKGQQK